MNPLDHMAPPTNPDNTLGEYFRKKYNYEQPIPREVQPTQPDTENEDELCEDR